MFYLFSSDFEPRFKGDILDILSYPEKHVFRFRYHANHVDPDIKHWVKSGSFEEKLRDRGTKGLVIYAETTGASPIQTFAFYPLREVEIIRAQLIGNVYYVDMRLGAFIDYFAKGDSSEEAQVLLTSLQDSINKLKFHPLPQLKNPDARSSKQGLTWTRDGERVPYAGEVGFTNQGYFFHYVQPNDSLTCHCGSGSLRPWESVAEVLSAAPSMERAVFYLIEGFYCVRKKWFLFGEHDEYLIEPVDNGWDTTYRLKMGTSVVLKLLFFRSSRAPRISAQSLEVKTDGDAFAGFSQNEIPIESRYNEERILIACKRVFDSIFALIEIQLKSDTNQTDRSSEFIAFLKNTRVTTPNGEFELIVAQAKNEPEVIAPHSFLLTQVVASKKIITATIVFLALASFFLFMSPDYLQMIGWSHLMQALSPEAGSVLVRNAPALTQVSKTLGLMFTLLAGYFGFRKLPLGK